MSLILSCDDEGAYDRDMKNRIFVTGYYGFMNTGDEAILASMLLALRTARPDLKITVTSATPLETSATHGVEAVLWTDPLAAADAVRACDLVIIGGGGIFHDYFGFDPGAFLTDQHAGIGFYTAPAVLGALYGKPVFLYSVGIGPLFSEKAKYFVRAACRLAQAVSVRDSASRRLLKTLGVDPKKVRLTADAAFGFVPGAHAPQDHPALCTPSLAVAVRPWALGVLPAYWESELASALDRYLESYEGIVNFVPFQRQADEADDDLRAAQRVQKRMEHSSRTIVSCATTPSEIYRELAASRIVIGMRLHSLILGLLAGVPMIALSYDTKVDELMRQAGLPGQLVDLKSIDSEQLVALIERTLSGNQPRGLAKKVGRLKSLALHDAKQAIGLLENPTVAAPHFTDELGELLKRALYANLRQNHHLRLEVQRIGAADQVRDPVKVEVPAEETGAVAALEPVPDDAGTRFEEIAPQQKYALIVFAIFDFDSRYQRPQHLAAGFADKGHRVFWISPFRTVSPSDPRAYEAIVLREGLWEVHLRERHEVYTGELTPDAAQVSYRGIRQLYADFEIAESCALLQFPFWRQLGLLLRQDLSARLVYDCMDDWQNWTAYPGVSAFNIEEEKRLDEESDLVVVSSREYLKRRENRNLPALLVRNGVDFDVFSSPAQVDLRSRVHGPVIGYFGAISDWFDYDLLSFLARSRPHYSFVLIGDANTPHTSGIRSLPNVHLLGEKDYREIPGYLSQFDVCLIPFLLNELTRGVDPVKLYEYLSQGKPVVASALPELPADSGLLYVARGPDDFLAKLDAAVNEDGSLREKRIEFARKNTWGSRVEILDQAVAAAFPKVSLLVVTYNSAEFLALCLTSIRRNTAWPNYEVIVVDNASQDDSASIARRYAAADPRVRPLPLDRNTGFAGGNNAAARQATGDYLVFLNPDTVVTPGWLERLVRSCRRDPTVGQVAAVTNFSGNETKINVSYTNAVEMMEFARGLAGRKAGAQLEIAIAPLYCVLMPRSVWERVGGLDEGFRVGTFEDDDLSLRVREAGYRVVVADDAFVHHFGNGSFGKIPAEQASLIYVENKRHYEQKWKRPAPRHALRPDTRSPYLEPMRTPLEFVSGKIPRGTLTLKSLHPETAVAGAGFNLQDGGESALGVRCENATPATVIVVDGQPLTTAWGNSGELSAIVPRELTAREGKLKVWLKDGGIQSDSLELLLTRSLPLVSCIMPTADRHAFVPRAIRQFLAQDYPRTELVVVDAGHVPVVDLIPRDSRIRYFRAGAELSLGASLGVSLGASLGALRNFACRQAAGDYIAHWDDDDWIASWRLSYQIQALLHTDSDVCGIDRMFYWDPVRNQAWRYTYPRNERPWLAGGSLAYRRSLWQREPFQEINVGEDNGFVWSQTPKRMAQLDHEDFYVALLHSGNTSPKIIEADRWIPVDPAAITAALGAEAAECRELVLKFESARANKVSQTSKPAGSKQHSPAPFAIARRRDLDLPEFLAVAQAFPLPRARQWELPFALFQARLSDRMAVFDCTIDPTRFREAIAALYPHVHYSHVNPLAGAELDTAAGFGAESFDRVFSIGTIEYLTTSQRAQLVAALAEKLKPGGMLIITCSHYFDAVRSSRGGFHPVSPLDLEELCRCCGLVPAGAAPDFPNGRDNELLVNDLPFEHGTIGAVFVKPPAAEERPIRVVLALLTWNTREISMESVAALSSEARMLQRAGVEAAICVVDNGSTDGTPEELSALDAALDIPHQFILNPRNVGSSRARNRMIDYMLEQAADYILFMDGDIEIVPCSSFAILRYMESSGIKLGCVGAYSAHFTSERANSTRTLFSLAQCRLHRSSILAWTQYGMFRRSLFESGIRFDESGPFGEPGHGLEDVDFALQMAEKGYANEYFEGIRYLHRHLSSSVGILRSQGVNPTARYYKRKEFLLAKWDGFQGIDEDSMQWLRHARAPWPEDAPPAETLQSLADRFSTDMINSTDLTALASALTSFSWSGTEIVVEIGAYTGSTTVFMAKVLETIGVRATIIAVDPFERCTPDALNPQGNYKKFMETIRAHRVEDRCTPIAEFSAGAAPAVPDRIGVLFIDGSHHYDAIRTDLELYTPKVVSGGYLYIHDYFDAYPDVIRAVDEFTAKHPEWERVARGNYLVCRVLK
jgi:polysaccharide pyruvyl transferase CsaB